MLSTLESEVSGAPVAMFLGISALRRDRLGLWSVGFVAGYLDFGFLGRAPVYRSGAARTGCAFWFV